MKGECTSGLRDGLAIGVGYFSVSFTFGILAVNGGLSPLVAGLISLTNMTSAGQFAGLTVILAHGSLVELALTQLVINLRYALMSLSLSQRLGPEFTTRRRMLVAFANTDEIFAVAMGRTAPLTPSYMSGPAGPGGARGGAQGPPPPCGSGWGSLFTACSSPSWCRPCAIQSRCRRWWPRRSS